MSVWLVLLAIIFVPLERVFGLRPSAIFRKDFAADLFYYFLSTLLPTVLLSVPLALLATAVNRALPQPMLDFIAGLPFWVRVAVSLVIGDFGAYWGHRWSHEIPFLWRFHAVHHSAEHMDWLVNTRAHPVDLVFTRLCGLVPLYMLGFANASTPAGSQVAMLTSIILTIWTFFIHANVKWRLGPLEWLVSTPAFHHWHHTVKDPLDRNYAALVPAFDKLFGTYYLPKDKWPEQYGVREPIAPDVAHQLTDPLIKRKPAAPIQTAPSTAHR